MKLQMDALLQSDIKLNASLQIKLAAKSTVMCHIHLQLPVNEQVFHRTSTVVILLKFFKYFEDPLFHRNWHTLFIIIKIHTHLKNVTYLTWMFVWQCYTKIHFHCSQLLIKICTAITVRYVVNVGQMCSKCTFLPSCCVWEHVCEHWMRMCFSHWCMWQRMSHSAAATRDQAGHCIDCLLREGHHGVFTLVGSLKHSKPDTLQ